MHTNTHVCLPLHIPTCTHSYSIYTYPYIHAYKHTCYTYVMWQLYFFSNICLYRTLALY